MSAVLKVSAPSIFPLSSGLAKESVGKKNPIDLPLIQIAAIGQTFGRKIAQGQYGGIYRVNGSTPQRVYKIIRLDQFANGDEIRVAKVAADIGIAPHFYGACLVQQQGDSFVLMEMDCTGKSLFRWMEDLALEPDLSKAALIEESSSQRARDKAMKELSEKKGDGSGFIVVAQDQTESVSMEAAVDKLYKSREEFFFGLFSALKKLAENKIVYTDTNCGNIIPDAENGLKLIDFDSAFQVGSPVEAVGKMMQAMYNQMHFKDFCGLKDLSAKSQELIKWFEKVELEWAIAQWSL